MFLGGHFYTQAKDSGSLFVDSNIDFVLNMSSALLVIFIWLATYFLDFPAKLDFYILILYFAFLDENRLGFIYFLISVFKSSSEFTY